MELYYSFVIFMFGVALGSFYNVVGSRLSEGKSIVNPPSSCTKCNHVLRWYELIPLLSFIVQGGKCRKCKVKLSWFYPMTELLTGVMLVISYLMFGFSYEFWISAVMSSFLTIVLVSDISYYVIPDEVTIVCSVMIFIINVVFINWDNVLMPLGSGVLMFSLMYLIMMLGNKIFKKESLGGGDVKLMFFVGMVLTPIQGISAIFLSSLVAFVVSMIILLFKKNDILPFGPYILIATIMMYWLDIDLVRFFEVLI